MFEESEEWRQLSKPPGSVILFQFEKDEEEEVGLDGEYLRSQHPGGRSRKSMRFKASLGYLVISCLQKNRGRGMKREREVLCIVGIVKVWVFLYRIPEGYLNHDLCGGREGLGHKVIFEQA